MPEWDREVPDGRGGTRWQPAILDLRISTLGDPNGFVDVTIRHPVLWEGGQGYAGPRTRRNAQAPGGAAARGEQAKRDRYQGAGAGRRLVPIAIETYGRWGGTALDSIRRATRSFVEGDQDGEERNDWGRSRVAQLWGGAISIALQNANADCITHAYGAGRPTEATSMALRADRIVGDLSDVEV